MPHFRAIAAAAVLGASLVALWACSGSDEQFGCPRVSEPPDTARIALFAPTGHDVKDVVVGGDIRNVDTKCLRARVGVDLEAEITFEAQRVSPAIKDADFPYYVALLDPNQNIIMEQGFDAAFPFLPGESYRRLYPEKITVNLPLKDRSTGGTYTIVVGFRLTPDQLAFNRAPH